MKGFPYGDFQVELLGCLAQTIRVDSEEAVLSLQNDELSLDMETRFLEEFKAKFIAAKGEEPEEIVEEFSETVKFEDVSKYYSIFSLIYRDLTKRIQPKLSSKNLSHFVKLESECTELIA